MPNSITPFISILIPVRNEAAYIKQCLDAVLAQDFPQHRMEILIADGMSEDETRQIIQGFQADHPHIQLIDNPSKIVPTGLNRLIQQATGDILIRVDGHCVIAPDYVRNCVELLQTTDADNVGGCMVAVGNDKISNVIVAATSTPFGVGGARFHYSEKEEWVDTVYLGAWRREVFANIGLFDEELVRDQDDEFNYRLRKFGGKIFLSPKIKSTYRPRGSFKKLWHQYFQYGFYKVRVLQKHPKQMRPRQFIPPVFVACLLLLLLLSLTFPWGWIPLVGFVGIYLLANLGASLLTARVAGWHTLPLLPLAFATLHISYGAGFLAGLAKFWNRWKT